MHDGQLPTFDVESKSAKIPKVPLVGVGWGGGVVKSNFQFLMPSPNLLKSQSPFSGGGGGGKSNFQFLMLSFLTKIATAKKLILSTEWPRRTLCVRGTIIKANFAITRILFC